MTPTGAQITPDSAQLPVAEGLPILGNALGMRNDPLKYLVSLYKKHGPIFQIKLLSKPYVVMGGLEANQFLARSGEVHFISGEVFHGFASELGSEALLNAIDGPSHKQRRKVMRRSHGRENLQARLPEIIQITRDYVSAWPIGERALVFDTIQRMVVHQLGLILVNQPPGDIFEELRLIMNTNLQVHIKGLWPRIMLRHPAYVKAKTRANELAWRIIAEHCQIPPVNRPFDLVDELINETDEDGNPLPESLIVAETIASYNAGMDTISNTCCFMLYGILKTPGLLARITEEVDSLFATGLSDLQALKDATTLHHAAMETLRLYPVAPLTYRTVSTPFEFGGYRVKQGARVFLVNAMTHYLPEYFPDPLRFDVDRYKDGIAKSRPANTFAPYTLGAHTCLGAGLAESLTLVVVATILHTLDLALDPPDYTIKTRLAPVPSPGRQFSLRILKKRFSNVVS